MLKTRIISATVGITFNISCPLPSGVYWMVFLLLLGIEACMSLIEW